VETSSLANPPNCVCFWVWHCQKSNFLMTSTNIKIFWLLLSIMKWSGVPSTHIYEWKRISHSLGSFSSSCWIIVVMMVGVCFSSMIYFILLFSESDSKYFFISFSMSVTTNDSFERHSSVLWQEILWKMHHFPVSFLIFMSPLFSCSLDWLYWGWVFYELGLHLTYCDCYIFVDFKFLLFFCLNFHSILTSCW
jgi:hypothetical protein